MRIFPPPEAAGSLTGRHKKSEGVRVSGSERGWAEKSQPSKEQHSRKLAHSRDLSEEQRHAHSPGKAMRRGRDSMKTGDTWDETGGGWFD